ncbi:ras-related protein RABD2a-like isoform X2 [Octopus sinensis]|uniref:Ras-related protein RABD2a-like isoform X2 n=1 Tax=Octopus sinensis TaxID=2607531 RepID=A0A7E6FPU2_9MOLL|nr:ras-related protein RABD2a-like isoform X2 [Octopus sinensis]
MCATGYFHQVSMARYTLLYNNNKNNKKIYGDASDFTEDRDDGSRGRIDESIHQVNLVVTGEAETGKASLIDKFVKKNCVLNHRGELSHNMLQRRTDEDTKRWQRILLHLKDTSTDAQWEISHRSIVHGYLIVFDVTNKETFVNVPKWCSKIFQKASKTGDRPCSESWSDLSGS